MNNRNMWIMNISAILLTGALSPSWAWVRFGFRGPAVGIYVTPGDPYYYDPYYPYYPAPYAVPPVAAYYYPAPAPAPTSVQAPDPSVASQTSASVPDNTLRDLTTINDELANQRARFDHDLLDGDIAKSEYAAKMGELARIEQEARTEFQTNGGYITTAQGSALLYEIQGGGSLTNLPAYGSYPIVASPSTELSPATEASPEDNSRRDVTVFSDQMTRLRSILDKKLADGDITKTQHDAEARHLIQIDQQAQSEAAANGGYFTTDQENTLLKQLRREETNIDNNFITN